LRRHHRQRVADRQAVARFAGRRLLDDEDIAVLDDRTTDRSRSRKQDARNGQTAGQLPSNCLAINAAAT
jgi:hypothetical protein